MLQRTARPSTRLHACRAIRTRCACVSSSCLTSQGWEIGTSSSLFNAILSTINSTVTSLDASVLEYLIDSLGNDVRNADNDVSNLPNPFGGLNASSYQDSASSSLDLVDGGEDGMKGSDRAR